MNKKKQHDADAPHTERKQSEERGKQTENALLESEHRMQQALRVSRSFTFEWLPGTDQVIRSASCGTILNLTGNEVVNDMGEHYFQCIHPDDRKRFVEMLQGLTPSTNCYTTEYRYVCKDGREITLEETGQASFDSAGKIYRLVGVSTDISARKQAEAALLNVNEELERRVIERTKDLDETIDFLSEEITERERVEKNLQRLNRLYAVLSETNHAIVSVSDRDDLFRDFCRIAVEHGGFILSWIGLVEEQSDKVRIAASSGATGYLDNIRITANKEPEGEGPTGIVIREGAYFICNDFQNDPCTRPWHEQGKAYGIFASASIAFKENGRVIGALTLYGGEKDYFDAQQVELLLQMGTEISFALDNLNRENRRKEAEKALYEETIERLKTVEALREKEQMLIQQSRLAAMGDMINNIAHQWRQPLNVLGLLVQQMQLYYEMGSFSKEYLDETVKKSMNVINHMSHTIDDFRDFFKPDKDKVEFAIIDVVLKTLTLVEDSFSSQQIIIESHVTDTPIIIGYPNEYAQVILNILLNAKDAFMENRPDNPKVIVTIGKDDERSVVTIADNAGGIPEENLFKIFEPYFTTKGPDNGSGLGLFMSKTIIEKNMNGRLIVRNNAEGVEFRIVV